MKRRNYTHVQELLPEIEGMISAGKTQREVAEQFGFKDKYVVKRLLKRQREKQRKLAAGNNRAPCGRPQVAPTAQGPDTSCRGELRSPANSGKQRHPRGRPLVAPTFCAERYPRHIKAEPEPFAPCRGELCSPAGGQRPPLQSHPRRYPVGASCARPQNDHKSVPTFRCFGSILIRT